MKKIFFLLTFVSFFFTSCSVASLYNLKPNQAILIPMSEPVYILNKKHKKDIDIIRLNGKYVYSFLNDEEKVISGKVSFLVRSYFMGHRRLAEFTINAEPQKAYFIFGNPRGNNMLFYIKVDGEVILEVEGKRKL